MAFYFLYTLFETNEKDENKNIYNCILAGVFFGLAILTKLMIGFLIGTFMVLLIFDILIYKNITKKEFLFIIFGILSIFLIEYLFRLVQFNFSFKKAFASIIEYIKDMYRQSKFERGFNPYGDFKSCIFDRVSYLSHLVGWSVFPILYILFPALIYIYYI